MEEQKMGTCVSCGTENVALNEEGKCANCAGGGGAPAEGGGDMPAAGGGAPAEGGGDAPAA